MADKSSQGEPKPEAQFAKRIDPAKADLTREQLQFIRQVELAQWRKKTDKLRGRNVVTGLAIGAVVLGICILHCCTTPHYKLIYCYNLLSNTCVYLRR
ncbi:cytochrome c oxidase assembly factor 3 mitochondrial [Labeo rohita]|uniref:Uncharacterized protein n=2 Tax=Labeo rohita TaxID=84645 RepID=A0ABQ8M7L1_LABRO|nr:hypothetical protein H4Q32_017039 [Labeo rohita]RXN22515.1 cytochrome c oxidase assembly factor 3 mitochondrial [Labeo rohita]